MGPGGRLVGGLKGVEFGGQALPQRRGLIGGQDRRRRSGKWLPAPGSPWRGQAASESMAVWLLPVQPGRLMIGLDFAAPRSGASRSSAARRARIEPLDLWLSAEFRYLQRRNVE